MDTRDAHSLNSTFQNGQSRLIDIAMCVVRNIFVNGF